MALVYFQRPIATYCAVKVPVVVFGLAQTIPDILLFVARTKTATNHVSEPHEATMLGTDING